ncbi:hypothetical protein ACIGW7_26510 [Streptomyces sp. NPDC053253]|uniref:hypothetical protein n=1 Tax=Streptomyces sp. NPDC053253 TaxID=3365699 RepID=UPI0037D18C1A
MTFFTRYRRNAFADANADPNRRERAGGLHRLRGRAEVIQQRTGPLHLLVHYPPKGQLAKPAGLVEDVSSRRLRQELPGPPG